MTGAPSVVSSGIAGLDDILHGGWPAERLFLIIGHPGTGKTTLGLQFLREGALAGERVLYVSLSETIAEVEQVTRAHGWSLDGISTYELTAAEEALGLADQQTMFDPTEIEFRQTSQSILHEIQRLRPKRVVFDSLAELALLAREPLAFRREVLLLKRALMDIGATALFLSDSTTTASDLQLQSLAHGVLALEELAPEYGGSRRRLRLPKLRGTTFRGGYHDYCIRTGGLDVFPRLVAAEHAAPFDDAPILSGIPQLDALTGGGLVPGSSTLILGPAGSGKSSVAMQHALGALQKGMPVAAFLFDEGVEMFLRRSEGIGQPLRQFHEQGALTIQQVDPAEMSPGEFVHCVRRAVEEGGARYVVIDSLNGYVYAMPEERYLNLHVHELLSYLNQRGVATVLVLAQHGIVGHMSAPAEVTYVADSVIVLRFFEAHGRMHRAISMLKKRGGGHETAIRELSIVDGGMVVGEPLHGYHGVFTGVPAVAPAEVFPGSSNA